MPWLGVLRHIGKLVASGPEQSSLIVHWGQALLKLLKLPPMSSPRIANAPFDALDADFILRTSDDIDFRVFRAILSLASPVFKDMLSLPQPASASSAAGLPVVHVSETSTVLESLLLICYPSIPPALETLRDVRVLLEAASKYDITCAVQYATTQLTSPQFLETNPVAVYCIAACYGLETEARIAALPTLNIPAFGRPSVYVEEMEFIPTSAYHRLVDYHYRCGQAAAQLTDPTIDLGWVYELDGHFPDCDCAAVDEDENIPRRLVWFFAKLGAVADELRDKPIGETVVESPSFRAAAEQIAMCDFCNPERIECRWDIVSEAFARKVGEEVSKVQLEFKL